MRPAHSALPAIILGLLATLLVLSTMWLAVDAMALRRRRPNARIELRLSNFLATLRSGDLLLASGALWMQALSRSHITHVAMLVQDPQDGTWHVWDTTRSRRYGAMLTPLSDFLHECYIDGVEREEAGTPHGRNSVLWRCRLGAAPDPAKLRAAIELFAGRPYSMRVWKAFTSTVLPLSLPLPVFDAEDAIGEEGGMFCTQLIASTLQECGVLERGRRASSYKPSDFWTGEGLQWSAGFAPGPYSYERILFPAGEHTARSLAAMVRAATATDSKPDLRSLKERMQSWLSVLTLRSRWRAAAAPAREANRDKEPCAL
jgi:hypothetical protein